LSAGVATAISLVASVLTAGLTIWAYSAMAAKDAGEEYEKAMEKANTSSQAQVATFNSLLAIARDTNLSYAQRKQAVDKLNSSHEGLKDTLSVENVNTKASIDLTNRLASSLVLQAQATAIATLAGEAYVENLRAKNSALQDYASTETSVLAQVLRNLGFFTKAEQLLIKDGAKNREEVIAKSQKDYDNYAKKLEEINKKLAESGMLSADGKKVKTYGSVIKNLKDELEQLDFTFTGTFGDKQEGRIKALQTAIDELRKLGFGKTRKEVKALADEIASLVNQSDALNLKKNPLKDVDLKSTTGGLAGLGAVITDEDLAREQQRLENINKQARAIDNLSLSTQNANQWVQYLAQTVGGELVNSFNEMLTTGTFSFEAIGKSILNMIKRLAAAAMAAAVLSSILSSIFPGAANTGFKDIFGMITNIRLGAGVAPTASPMAGNMTTSGINTSINTANSSSGGGVLETRVSGNDLVILLDRASNNRNKYF
jgi:hypothetical protein